jgi:hypothetical protein
MPGSVNLTYSRISYAYTILIGTSSVATLLGLHREFYALLGTLSVPAVVVSCLTGLVNLSWYELAFVVGGFVKSVRLFTIIPFIGAGLGILSAVMVHVRFRFRRQILFAHLASGIVLAVFSLLILLFRLLRGYDDYWRLLTTVMFLLMYTAWLLYFRRERKLLSPS